MDNNKFIMSEIINFETELFNKTKYLYTELMDASDKKLPIVDFRLSEIHTLKQTLRVYLSLNEEYYHHEITSLLNFWDQTFIEMKEVVENNDSNTSWLYSSYDTYEKQHEIVDSMLRSHI